MEGTAFSIEEASFDASLLPEGSRTPGTVAFHRAVSDYFQKSYASMGGQLSVVFAAGRIEVAWEPAPPEAQANAGDAHAQANAYVALGLAALRQEDRAEARQALEAAIELEPQNAFALRSLGSLLVIAGALAAGAERFRQARAVAPDDLITTFNLS